MSTPEAVVRIPVDASAFERFADRFSQYQHALRQTADQWHNMAQGMRQSNNTFAQQVALMDREHEQSKELLRLQRDLAGETERTSKAWEKIGGFIKSAASSILGMVSKLVTFGANFGLGLLGANHLFGLGGLAGSAANQYRTAQGLGMSTAQLAAARNGLAPILDPDEYLGWINEQETSYNQLAAHTLLGRGMSNNVQKDMVDLLRATHAATQGLSLQQLGLFNQQHGTQFNIETLRRIQSTSPDRLAEILAQAQDTRGMGASAKTSIEWQRFTQAMERAGQQIETVFVQGLVGLSPQLRVLSHEFVDFVRALGNSKAVKDAVTGLGEVLAYYGKKLSDPKIKDELLGFFDRLRQHLEKLEPAFRQFVAELPDLLKVVHDVTHFRETISNNFGASVTDRRNAVYDAIAQQVEAHPEIAGLDKLLYKVAEKESSYGTNQKAFDMGIGAFGLTKGATSDAGFDPARRNDIDYAAGVAAALLIKRLKEYGGDQDKVMASFAGGEGLINVITKKYPTDWRQHLGDAEYNTGKYQVNGVGLGRQAAGEINIKIMNATGGSAVITVGGLSGVSQGVAVTQ